jgi:hypothetical protein
LRGLTLICASPHNADMDGLFTHELRLEAGKTVFAGERRKFFFEKKH